jgi:hypothetical protein
MACNALNSKALVVDTSLQSLDRNLLRADPLVPLYLTTMTEFESIGVPRWHPEPDPECRCKLRYTLHNAMHIWCHCCGELWAYRDGVDLHDPIPHLVGRFAKRNACWKGVMHLASRNLDIKRENLLRAPNRYASLTLKYRKASQWHDMSH